MKIDLEDLERKARAATPGERTFTPVDYRDPGDRTEGIWAGDEQIVKTDGGVYPPNREDAEFICAASPEVVLELLARLRDAMRIIHEEYCYTHGHNKKCLMSPEHKREDT